jgi:hypothetical protein
LLARLPNAVIETQRGELVTALAEAQPLVIEVSPGTGVRIWSGDRLLVHVPAPAGGRARRSRGMIAIDGPRVIEYS